MMISYPDTQLVAIQTFDPAESEVLIMSRQEVLLFLIDKLLLLGD